jgi:hypothetical protein
MSRGLGKIERECLRAIEAREVAGKESSTVEIAADVYEIKRDRRGRGTISQAQYVATKRALAGLRRKGLVNGQQALMQCGDGGPTVLAQASSSGRARRSCYWSTPGRPDVGVDEDTGWMKSNARIAFEMGVSVSTVRTKRALLAAKV